MRCRAAQLIGQVGVHRRPGRAIRQVRRDPAEDLRQRRLDMPVLLGVGGQLAAGQRPGLPAAVKRVIQQALAADPRPDKTSGLRSMQWHGRNASISGPQHQGRRPRAGAGDSHRSQRQERECRRGNRQGVPPGLVRTPGQFRKLDAVAVLTARLLPAPRVVPVAGGSPQGAVKQYDAGIEAATVLRRHRRPHCYCGAAYLVSALIRRSVSSSTLPVLGRSRSASWSLSSALVRPS